MGILLLTSSPHVDKISYSSVVQFDFGMETSFLASSLHHT